ncbi:cupin domain-containing protein [Alloalcanivorax mobilis]|uniref:zf-HC2 domain-containing protein n=1 Tax=Alloalcanivorax mobilis TaxID=2019569 RepID=UPI000B5B16E3|nr:zf-HC2 domain-containing protein [Alloalcanivorax mobilis]ASK35402.1 hypothetical protein CEK62_13935 [Alcanivorax sp. N3-2A]|tara:strand:+ start:25407 stop:25646 length:240 start_codon:yes stop_codon:yes gene_type:complete
MLSCKHLVDNADRLIDGAELRPGQRFALRAHLMICRHCRRYLRQLRALTAHLNRRAPPPADDAQTHSVLQRLDPDQSPP